MSLLHMEIMWNKLHLQRPAMLSYTSTTQKHDAVQFSHTINKLTKDLTYVTVFHTEGAILSRLIYRMKRKFRNDKGLKNMEKVNRALLNYLSMDFEREIANLENYVDIHGVSATLPSKQLLEYMLVRTQGFSKLMCRIEWVARNAAHYLKTKICLGHAWTMSTIAYSVISRIWVLSRHLIKKSCNWYHDLYKYIKSFKIIGVPWLPQNYSLPTDLKEWLDLPWIDDKLTLPPTEESSQRSIFNLITFNTEESEETLNFDIETLQVLPKQTFTDSSTLMIPSKEKVLPHSEKESACDENEQFPSFEEDIGELVRRKKKKKSKLKEKLCAAESKILECNGKNQLNTVKNLEVNKCVEQNGLRNTHSQDDCLQKQENLPRKQIVKLKDIETKEDLIKLLTADSYHNLNDLQWKLVKNSSKTILKKLKKCDPFDKQKEEFLIKKAIFQLQKSIRS